MGELAPPGPKRIGAALMAKEAPMTIPKKLIVPILVLSTALACSSGANPPDGIGEARMEVTQVPQGVGCLRVVAAATRAVEFDFNVSPGTSSVLNLSGIPTGRVDFSASAFPLQCPPAPGAVPTWVSDQVTAMVGAGVVAQVTLAMHPNGRARVGVDFGDEPACAATGAACQNPSACCSSICVADTNGNGTCAPPNGGACSAPQVPCPGMGMGGVVCTDVTSDSANCGMCGNACPSGTSCVMGACTPIAPVGCPAPLQLCPGPMGIVCSDRFADANNCGACGLRCPPGSACVMGACDGSCAPPRQTCMGPFGPVCSALSSDATNCGACGAICPPGRACISGMCR
jgi:hypothetical protein